MKDITDLFNGIITLLVAAAISCMITLILTSLLGPKHLLQESAVAFFSLMVGIFIVLIRRKHDDE